MLINNCERQQSEIYCKVCLIPKNISNKKQLKIHISQIHNGRNDHIKVGNSVRKLSKDEVNDQSLSMAKCPDCNEELSCTQYLDNHRKETHNIIG